MYHLGAIYSIFGALLSPNMSIVFPAYKLSPSDALESIAKYKCNTLLALPKIVGNILDENQKRKLDISSLTVVMAGGQHVNAELIERVKNETHCWVFSTGYGMTEIGGLTGCRYFVRSFHPAQFSSCVGKPSAFSECKIVDPETGCTQPLDAEGELYVRGYNVTRGYWNDPQMTAKLLNSDGWYDPF